MCLIDSRPSMVNGKWSTRDEYVGTRGTDFISVIPAIHESVHNSNTPLDDRSLPASSACYGDETHTGDNWIHSWGRFFKEKGYEKQ